MLLIRKGGLYKSMRFKDHKYVGDPINAVKIFNEKEVDEIIVLDIDATVEKRKPNLKMIREIAEEAFMPLSYGGGIVDLEQVKNILYSGVEKVIFNHSAIHKPALISETAKHFGSSSVVISIDAKRDWLGKYKVYGLNGLKNTGIDPISLAKRMEAEGAGEIFLNAIDHDGTFQGFDICLIASVAREISIPVVACGGAGTLGDFRKAIKEGGASAAAAGSYFVLQRPHRAVLITYPSQEELQNEIYLQI